METAATISMAFLVLVVLLPLVPAYVLFRVLPGKGEVSGPLQGLTIKFSGASAGYLVLFLSLLYVRPTDFNHYHTWKVSGRIALETRPGETPPNIRDIVVRVVPPHLDVMNGGAFAFEIPVLEDERGRPNFPALQVDLRSFQGATLALSRTDEGTYGTLELRKRYNDLERRIVIDSPVTLRSLATMPEYNPGTAEKVAQPVAADWK